MAIFYLLREEVREVLEVNNVTKIFNRGSINEKVALNNLSLRLEAGDVVAVIGSNGAGKSTLLNVAAGVFPIDRGEILLEGRPVHKDAEHMRAAFIGRVFQDPALGTAASMTIEENLILALKRGQKLSMWPGKNKERRELFSRRLELLGLGLENRLTTKVGLLSGGQRQALTVIMATIVAPKLLLLDEHTAALDPKTGRAVLDLSEQIITEEKLTTLMVTHNMEQALRVGNRTIMMHEGSIILDIKGEQRKDMQVKDLLQMFERASGRTLDNDRMLLSS